jgi:hypothetical protein
MLALTGVMGDHTCMTSNGFEDDSPQFPDYDTAFQAAQKAVLFPDLETATETFAMGEAVDMILDSIENGTELDRERLGRLAEIMDAPPRDYVDLLDDGTHVYYEDGVEVDRVESTPEEKAWRLEQKRLEEAESAEISDRADNYISLLEDGLQSSEDGSSSHTIKVYKHEKVLDRSRNSLELEAFELVKYHFKAHGFTVREEHQKLTDETMDSGPQHRRIFNLHTFTVSKEVDFQLITDQIR